MLSLTSLTLSAIFVKTELVKNLEKNRKEWEVQITGLCICPKVYRKTTAPLITYEQFQHIFLKSYIICPIPQTRLGFDQIYSI